MARLIDEKQPSDAQPLPENLLGVVRTLWRERRRILAVVLIAAVGAALISLLLPDYYKAETTFIPLSPEQSSPESLFGNTNSRTQLYGNTNDLDRLMAIAESNELLDFLVDSFDLYTHYDIDPKGLRASVEVRNYFRSLYSVGKTVQDVITLNVEDREPVKAAQLANAARERMDFLSRKIILDAQGLNAGVLEREIEQKTSELNTILDSLNLLKDSYKLYDVASQTAMLSQQFADVQQEIVSARAKIATYKSQNTPMARDSVAKLSADLSGYVQSRISLDSQLVQLAKGTGPIQRLQDRRNTLTSYLANDTERLKRVQAALAAQQPTLALLERAQVPVIKSRPARSLLVIAAGVLGGFFAAVVLLLMAQGRRYAWEEIFK